MKFVLSLNAIRDNIWALLIIGAGVILIIKHQEAAGSSLVTLGAAVFQRQSLPALSNQQPAPAAQAEVKAP